MNRLQDILIWCSIHYNYFHTDTQNMCNSVKLRKEDWCFQRYIWDPALDLTKILQEKVTKTLIYGVRSSGNQAERGMRDTANRSKVGYPEAAEIVQKGIYVGDCLSGEKTTASASQRADELELVLIRGGFTLKGCTFSGQHPLEHLSDDGISISIAGLRWYPKEDTLALDIGDLNFAKRIRGRKLRNDTNKPIPIKLTRRHFVSKIAEIFDLTGKITPIVPSMKLDLHDLVKLKLDWDDVIPDDQRGVWTSNFQMIQEMKDLRALVPSDAVNLDINTMDFGDASRLMACSAIYVRFKRSNGEYSCQLVLGRSKIRSENTSQPRAELFAALLNTHSGEVVRRSFGKYHASHPKLSDREIVLHWLKNDGKPLKQWVRNRVIEIRRFTDTNHLVSC